MNPLGDILFSRYSNILILFSNFFISFTLFEIDFKLSLFILSSLSCQLIIFNRHEQKLSFFNNKILLNSGFEFIKRKNKLQNKKIIRKVLQITLSIKGAFPKALNLSEIKMRFSDSLKLNNKNFKQKNIHFNFFPI